MTGARPCCHDCRWQQVLDSTTVKLREHSYNPDGWWTSLQHNSTTVDFYHEVRNAVDLISLRTTRAATFMYVYGACTGANWSTEQLITCCWVKWDAGWCRPFLAHGRFMSLSNFRSLSCLRLLTSYFLALVYIAHFIMLEFTKPTFCVLLRYFLWFAQNSVSLCCNTCSVNCSQ